MDILWLCATISHYTFSVEIPFGSLDSFDILAYPIRFFFNQCCFQLQLKSSEGATVLYLQRQTSEHSEIVNANEQLVSKEFDIFFLSKWTSKPRKWEGNLDSQNLKWRLAMLWIWTMYKTSWYTWISVIIIN